MNKFDIRRKVIMTALAIGVSSSTVTAAFAQKDSRGWDGTSSSMYNTPSSSGASSYGSSFGSYGGPSHGSFTPFGRVSPSYSSSSSSMGSSNSYGNSYSTPSPPAGNYYDSIPALNQNSYHPGSNGGVNKPFGNPNPQFTPPPTLSFQEQQIRNKQREQEYAQARQSAPAVIDSTQQARRWENEFRQQHPGEPMPNAGRLQQMHIGEIQTSINHGFNVMQQRANAKSADEYALATKLSQRNAAQDGVTWNKAQFDRDYTQSHIDHANAYTQSVLDSRRQTETRMEMDRIREVGN